MASMAEDPSDPFTGSIRALVGPRDAVKYERPMRELILAVPAMTAQIRNWISGPGFQPGIVRLHGFAMEYLYSPDGLLPETSMGLFGYLDDAYLVARVYHRTLLEADCLASGPLPAGAPQPGSVHDWIRLARQLLPRETAALDKMLDEVFATRAGNYAGLLEKAAVSGRAKTRPAGKQAARR
ncbi:MAG: hypothetical protein RDU13_11815 [Elusimicrobiales bacterium]|nr:hypothetical protein [Elusimicrobiales bacterium]